MPSLEDLVTSNATKDEIKDVPPIPVGTYLAMIVGQHEMRKAQTGNSGVEWTCRFISAKDDVDQERLKEHLEASDRGLNEVTIKHAIWDSAYAAQQIRDFVYDTLDIDPQMPLKQAMAEAAGKNFYMSITHRPTQGRDGVARLQAQINGTAKAD